MTPIRLRLLLVRFQQNGTTRSAWSRPEPPGVVRSRLESSGAVRSRSELVRVVRSCPESFGIRVVRSRPESFGIRVVQCRPELVGVVRSCPESFGVVWSRSESESSGVVRRNFVYRPWFRRSIPDDSDSRRLRMIPDDFGQLQTTSDDSGSE